MNSSQQSAVMTSNQTSQNDSHCNILIYNPYVVPVLQFLMLPVALLLNGVAAWVALHLKSTSTFVVYLKNLVAADVIMTLLIPIQAASDLPDASNLLVVLSCRYFNTFFYSSLYTCITLLGIISLDRFFKIMWPQGKIFQNLIFSKVVSGSVWIIIFGGTGLPNVIVSNQSVTGTEKITSCMKLKGQIGLKLHQNIVTSLNVFFWLVSVLIAVCYICIANRVVQSFRNSGSSNNQGKKKIKLRVFLVVIVFFGSFGPYHIVRFPYTFHQVSSSTTPTCQYKFAKDLSLWLANTNICMNPLLYVFLYREFKEKLISMMKNLPISFKVASGGEAEATSSQT